MNREQQQERAAMTDEERAIARALHPSRVSYVPGTTTKRFARDIADTANKRDAAITTAQRQYLLTLCVRMRRQVPPEVVELARELLSVTQTPGDAPMTTEWSEEQ